LLGIEAILLIIISANRRVKQPTPSSPF
jgi:hypothetical protein